MKTRNMFLVMAAIATMLSLALVIGCGDDDGNGNIVGDDICGDGVICDDDNDAPSGSNIENGPNDAWVFCYGFQCDGLAYRDGKIFNVTIIDYAAGIWRQEEVGTYTIDGSNLISTSNVGGEIRTHSYTVSENTLTFVFGIIDEYTDTIVFRRITNIIFANANIVDCSANAKPLTLDAWTNGYIAENTTRDEWFVFTANADTQFIHFNSDDLLGAFLRLYDSDCNLLGSTSSFRDGLLYNSRNVTPGEKYYMRILLLLSDGYGAYQIAVNTSSTPPSP